MAAPEAVYQSCRFRKASFIFAMKPAPSGKGYTVRLHFAELTCNKPGERIFDVKINGKTVLKDFDIYQAAGGKDKAVVKEFTGVIPDADGLIDIDPVANRGMKEPSMINGIEIF
jgi:hypothetical protein